MKTQISFKSLLVAVVAVTSIVFFAPGCKKKSNDGKIQMPEFTLLDKDLKADFGYKPGTYWIYKDSVSGEIDSAYVSSNMDTMVNAGGCVLSNSYYEKMDILVKFVCVTSLDANPKSMGEEWHLSARYHIMDMFMSNKKDSLLPASYPLGAYLFDYPFQPGDYHKTTGCVISYIDSGYIKDIYPHYTLNGHTYNSTAIANHKYEFFRESQQIKTSNSFYISSDAGIIKAVFNGADNPSFYRVLELQRYNIVK
ncbi:MAG: hypothetical protein JWQ38_1520 [Flavipsychrobacter sp.]|nr:hypothetical protein [Flavipsychrobacter sp.]